MRAARAGSLANKFIQSSKVWDQYSDFFTPFSYAAWKKLSWFRAATPIPNCVIGCRVRGKLEQRCIVGFALKWWSSTYESTRSSMNLGNSPLSASSLERVKDCSLVGIWPVRSNQNMLSGMISFPPGAGGRTFWQSGIDNPWKRIPWMNNCKHGIQDVISEMYLNRVKDWSFPEHGLQTSHTADDVLNLNYSGLESQGSDGIFTLPWHHQLPLGHVRFSGSNNRSNDGFD